jgi:hypothetical protein
VRRAALPLLLLICAACPGRAGDTAATPRAPDTAPRMDQLTVELKTQPLEGGDDRGGRVVAEGASGGANVRGMLSAPNPCYRLSGSVARSGATVTLTVTGRASDGGCIQSIGAFAYDASVRGLPPGAYTLRVVHTYPGTGWETRTALETSITVP